MLGLLIKTTFRVVAIAALITGIVLGVTYMLDCRTASDYFQESIDKYFWRLDRFVGAALGYVVDYGSVVKADPYKDMFQEWVLDDFVLSITMLEQA